MSEAYFERSDVRVPCQHIRTNRMATIHSTSRLRNVVRKYVPLDNRTPRSGDITIIAAHCNGYTKELYEPLWDELYLALKDKPVRIRAIWFADAYFQGSSGVLNENELANDPSWYDHARDLLLMVNLLRDEMPPPLVGVGHSIGACVIVNTALLHPRLFSTLILAEAMIKRGPSGRERSSLSAAYAISKRRETWSTRTEAEESLRKSKIYKTWDPRVLDLYLVHGLRDIKGKDAEQGRVVLTTPKHQEAWGIARPAFPPDRRALSSFNPSRKTHLDLATGAAYNADTPFYRPESYLTFQSIQNVQPTCLYVCGEYALNGEQMRHDLMTCTGVGIGGNGGSSEGSVKTVVIPKCGHFLTFEKPQMVASHTAEWLCSEAQHWREQDEEDQAELSEVSKASLQKLDEDYEYWMHKTFGSKL